MTAEADVMRIRERKFIIFLRSFRVRCHSIFSVGCFAVTAIAITAVLVMLCFTSLLWCRHSANVLPRISFMKCFRALWCCLRVKRRLLVCPLRLSLDVNSWMHYFNWTPTMVDSYLLQPTLVVGIVVRCRDWRNDKEIIFFVTVQVFLRYVKIHRWREVLALFSCICFFSASHFSLSSNAASNQRKHRVRPLFFYSLLNTNQIVFFFLFYLRVHFNRFHSLLCFLSIYLIFFLTFSHREISIRSIVGCVPSVTRSFVVAVTSFPLDSIQATAVMMIRWRPRCANTSNDHYFFLFFANKDEKCMKNTNRDGCAVLAAEWNKSRSIVSACKNNIWNFIGILHAVEFTFFLLRAHIFDQ